MTQVDAYKLESLVFCKLVCVKSRNAKEECGTFALALEVVRYKVPNDRRFTCNISSEPIVQKVVVVQRFSSYASVDAVVGFLWPERDIMVVS